jgi:hypothetical protein
MEDLDYPQDGVALVGNSYSQYTTRFINEYLSKHNQSQYKEEPYKERHYAQVSLLSFLNYSLDEEETMDILSNLHTPK